MDNDVRFPAYIPRDEEKLIRELANRVRETRESRAVLLYGAGGSGKSRMLTQLARARTAPDEQMAIWLDPIDIDDSEYWLLSNLERHVAGALDPQGLYFKAYLDDLSRLPTTPSARASHETILSHLTRIKQVFQDCYRDFINDTGQTVVILFDTVEAVRGTSLLLTLTLWMKALPATLFVLAGRPLPAPSEDPIRVELGDPHMGIPVTTVFLGDFSHEAARAYLEGSSVGSGLAEDEKEKLVLLTRGHPLWLAFTISYLEDRGLPEEAAASLEAIARAIPYGGEVSPEGSSILNDFKRRLLAPYRDADFWHEAIKVLAVVRQTVNEPIWLRLMEGQPLPPDVASMADAWRRLLGIPWVRPRANRRCVTLHDAVAEELADRIIAVHDQDGTWRRELWHRAAAIYLDLTEEPLAALEAEQAAQDARLQSIGASAGQKGDSGPSTEERAFVDEAAHLDIRRRELDQFRVAGLFYRLLWDYDGGCQVFLDLFGQAKAKYDVIFQELMSLEMQRFLPGGPDAYPLGDVVGLGTKDFSEWLSGTEAGQRRYLQVGLEMADYLVRDDRATEALDLLDELPTAAADYRQRYEFSVLRGNACMRVAGRVREGLGHFTEALTHAMDLTSADRHALIANAHKEIGFYYRNQGLWREADEAYELARDAILAGRTGSDAPGDRDRAEMASIQTNWAYVKGLVGSYRDGAALAESAIKLRQRLEQRHEEGISWSVCGEIYRYERRFERAWAAYAAAEEIFQELSNWQWLGVIYQEQAICLHHATQDKVSIVPEPGREAERRITQAVEICRDHAVRSYPSALNRAGRIFGHQDLGAGLGYLAEAIDAARRMSDGWFWCASLLEYLEMSYRAWSETRNVDYLDQIDARRADIDQAMSEYEFEHLRGRWYLLQGHLAVHQWEETADDRHLDVALSRYADGFMLMAQGYVASSGATAIPNEIKKFNDMLGKLPPAIRSEWLEHLGREWSRAETGSTLLLAQLEELY
jgi:tetratricopeptide (TPR) repeat protein